jgi:Ser/Thr protein kinase RdoA (MazF antagonist)
MDTKPFALLTPDCIIDALESVGLRCDGRLLALNSYENRVYQVGLEEGTRVVVKFYRPGRWSNAAILEEHAFLQELAEAELPVLPPLALGTATTLHEFEGFRFSVFPRQGGRVPEVYASDTLQQIGRLLGRLHAIGALRPFQDRPTLDIYSFGEEPLDYLLTHEFIPTELAEVYRGVTTQALEGVRRCFERAGSVRHLRLHGDCYPGNLLWTDDGPHFVDFDDSRRGPAVQDMWMLLSGERLDMERQLTDLLDGYQSFYDFNTRELYLVEALRTLRLIHYSAWLARRWDDPAFPAAFPWFNTPRYWQDRILELREQIALMDEPPLWPA